MLILLLSFLHSLCIVNYVFYCFSISNPQQLLWFFLSLFLTVTFRVPVLSSCNNLLPKSPARQVTLSSLWFFLYHISVHFLLVLSCIFWSSFLSTVLFIFLYSFSCHFSIFFVLLFHLFAFFLQEDLLAFILFQYFPSPLFVTGPLDFLQKP